MPRRGDPLGWSTVALDNNAEAGRAVIPASAGAGLSGKLAHCGGTNPRKRGELSPGDDGIRQVIRPPARETIAAEQYLRNDRSVSSRLSQLMEHATKLV
jgi:hypothetical protein